MPRKPIPVDDIPSGKYSEEEAETRRKLASLYRLVDVMGWSQGIYAHISGYFQARIPGTESLLINGFPLLFQEITADNLIRINLDGKIEDGGKLNLGANDAGSNIHSAIQKGRPDVNCVIHLHTVPVCAVSTMRCGLLPLCQEAMSILPVAYHDYNGIVHDPSVNEATLTDLGQNNIMILRNHGFLTMGDTIEAAFLRCNDLVFSCETQVNCLGAGMCLEDIVLPAEKAQQSVRSCIENEGGGVLDAPKGSQLDGKQWAFGKIEWEGWMRMLDYKGHQTGYKYSLQVPYLG